MVRCSSDDSAALLAKVMAREWEFEGNARCDEWWITEVIVKQFLLGPVVEGVLVKRRVDLAAAASRRGRGGPAYFHCEQNSK
jgi:hypothetical protein